MGSIKPPFCSAFSRGAERNGAVSLGISIRLSQRGNLTPEGAQGGGVHLAHAAYLGAGGAFEKQIRCLFFGDLDSPAFSCFCFFVVSPPPPCAGVFGLGEPYAMIFVPVGFPVRPQKSLETYCLPQERCGSFVVEGTRVLVCKGKQEN